MVVNRVSNAEKQAKTLNEIESKFVAGIERNNLKALTTDELARQFEEIGQQAQLLQGRILLEAKSRFETTNDFGAWIQKQGGTLCAITKQHRTRLMNLAEFFDGDKRTLEGISITAAYEISAPTNAKIAVEVYESVRGKDMSVAEVKRQIAIRKGESLPITENNPVRIIPTDKPLDDDEIIEKAVEIMEESVKTETVKIGLETDLKTKLYAEIGDTPPFDAIRVLQEMINEIRDKVYRK